MWFFLFFLSNSWAVSDQDIAVKNKVRALQSYKSYLAFEKKQKEFENKQKKILQKRKKHLRQEEQRKILQNKAYALDFLNNVQFEELQDKIKSSPLKKMSALEKAFLVYQKKQQSIDSKRVKAFLSYKEKYKKYQERKKKILTLRLKAVSALRDRETNNQIPVF